MTEQAQHQADAAATGRRPRVIAIAVIRNGDDILVLEGRDEVKGETFYRPLGGGVEFGEYGEDAVIRELREEIDAEVEDVRFLGTIENVFTYRGELGHEIVLCYDATLADADLYHEEVIEGHDHDFVDGVEVTVPIKAVWRPLSHFRGEDPAPLYPTGLIDVLLQH